MKKSLLFFFLSLLMGGLFAQTTVFINELHYDNSGTDADEGFEIAGPAATDLSAYRVILYNGNGGAPYDSIDLSGTIADQSNGLGAIWFAASGMQNGAPDGIALVQVGGPITVVQFLSYEGSFDATAGSANGVTSTDIVVSEPGDLGHSLQLGGTGNTYEDFTWQAAQASTHDAINTGQTITSGSPDTDPPVFESGFPAYVDIFETRFNLVVAMDEPGTAYYLVLAVPHTAPTNEEVRAGDTLEIAEAAPEEFHAEITGLTASTEYTVYCLAEDDEDTPNVQSVYNSGNVTTSAVRDISMTNPVGGESYYLGDSVNFTWTSSNIDSIDLWYFDIDEGWGMINEEAIPAVLGEHKVEVGKSTPFDSTYLKVSDHRDSTFNSKSGYIYLIDTLPPEIEEQYPAPGSDGVPQNLNLRLIFNEMVDTGYGDIVLKYSDGTTVATIDVRSDAVMWYDHWVEIELPEMLHKDSSYFVQVHEGAFIDRKGNQSEAILANDDWTFKVMGQDLYISEYIEGGSSRKAIEIHNPTDGAVNLENYRLAQSNNGGGWEYYHYFPATMLDANDLWVMITDDTDYDTMTVFDKSDADEVLGYQSNDRSVFHNGNDARALEKTIDGGETWFMIDVFGDPYSNDNFDVAGVSGAAANHTIWRKDIFKDGNVDWAASSGTNAWDSEWVVSHFDDFSNLGLVSPKSDSLADIKSFVLNEQHSDAVIDSAAATIDIVVAMDTKMDSLFPDIMVSDGAWITPASGDSIDASSGSVTYTVESEDRMTTRVWTVNFTEYELPSSENDIVTFVLAEQTGDAVIDAVAHTVTVEVEYGTSLTALVPTITVSAAATISPASEVAQDFSAGAVTYTVTAQDESTQDWAVTVTEFELQEFANLAALRAATADNTTLYKLTGEVILTAQTSYRSKKYVQDATGGIEIDDDPDNITTIYDIGDGITGLVGTLEDYYGFLEFHPAEDPGAATSTGNAITVQTITIDEFKTNFEDYESEIVRLDTVTFVDTTGGFDALSNFDIFRDDDSSVVRIHFTDKDFDGVKIPKVANVTGIALWHYSEAKVGPRTPADVEEVVVEPPDNVSLVNNPADLSLYPNPSEGLFTLEWRGNSGDLDLEIFSLNGKLVYSKAYRSVSTIREQIDLSKAEPGMYLLRLRTADRVSVSKLILK